MHRRVLDVALILWLVTMASTGLPQWVPGVKPAERFLWSKANWIGVAQCDWRLFAPNPDRTNTWVEVVLTASDGTEGRWTTPNWRELSHLQRVLHIRWYKYADKLRQDNGAALRGPVLRYVRRELQPPEGERWVHAKLIRHWWTVPNSTRMGKTKIPLPWPPPREQYPGSYVVVERDL